MSAGSQAGAATVRFSARALARLSALLALCSAGVAQDLVAVGAGRVDITPDGPIRLSGYGSRRAESEGVEQRLWAKALAIGADAPCVLIAVDSTGVPDAITEEVARRLAAEAGIPRERFALASTHTHSAPLIDGVLGTLFGEPVPEAHRAAVRRYTTELPDRLERAALEALADRRPRQLAWARGHAGFAANRRTAGGPVDRNLSTLLVTEPDGSLAAVAAGYACHCTTLGGDFNAICGDWAGYAQEEVERAHPGATALVVIGCGADANPAPRGSLELAQRHGREIAREVERLLAFEPRPLRGAPTCRFARTELDFAPHPSRAEWEERALRADAVGYHARVQLARLDAGTPLATTLSYPIQTWCFGDDLAMVFLAGEVVVDYSLRLARELDASRAWVVAYANDVPCYIPSRRILAEGGYEAAGAMTYYDRPGPLAETVEERIVTEVLHQVPDAFAGDASGLPSALPVGPATAALRTRPGFVAELVASEPLVVDPVAIDFGDDGRLWVVEMRDYPSGMDGALAPGGRVCALTDMDGDGRYDRSDVFLDGLPFPTGLLVVEEGVLVCAAPDVILAKDTDGDGRADDVRTVFTGFATENYQARVNSLVLGLDGWIYGANGLLGGTIRGAGGSTDIGGRDFRFRLGTGELEAVAGLTQQGRDKSDFGDWFGCDNSTLAWHYPLPERYVRRNPLVAAPAPRVSIAVGPDPTRLFPTSRIAERFNDAGNAGRVTSACGLAVYRDDLLGADVTGDLFVCEPVHNLVTRLHPETHGSTFVATRVAGEESTEFLSSTDPWFRPVQVRAGPDGALWVVDMARAVIEHPRWITPETLARLDVRAGADLGRIYRVVPEGAARRTVPDLAALDTAELVAALDSPSGWQRDRAQARLVRAADEQAPALLASAALTCPRATGRVHALCTLDLLGALDTGTLAAALADPHPGVRRHAVRLVERMPSPWDAALEAALLERVADPDPQVRLQLACTLGEWADPRAGEALGRLYADASADVWLVGAVQSSAGPHLARVLAAALASPPVNRARVRPLALMAARAGDARALGLVLERIAGEGADSLAGSDLGLLADVLDALDQAPADLRGDPRLRAAVGRLDALVDAGERLAEDSAADLADRERALTLFRLDSDPSAAARLQALLAPDVPNSLQAAAVLELARRASPGAADLLLEAWRGATPATRSAIVQALLAREAWTLALLDRAETDPMLARSLDLAQRSRLTGHESERVRSRAVSVLGVTAHGARADVLARYRAAAKREGDASRGAALFAEHCGTCHRYAGVGEHVGPDLAALSDRSPEALLTAILDPNRAVLANYTVYVAETKDGEILPGIVGEETATSLALTASDGTVRVLLRSELASLTATELSLMPEGLEELIPPDAMPDLLAFLATPAAPRLVFAGNRPRPIEPEPDGRIVLAASEAEIYGAEIRFEEPFRNVGYWHGAGDHVDWTLLVPETGDYTVTLEWACPPGSAGNTVRIECAGEALTAPVVATGGWSDYARAAVGTLHLTAGRQRLVVRSEGEVHGALFDLRAVELGPD